MTISSISIKAKNQVKISKGETSPFEFTYYILIMEVQTNGKKISMGKLQGQAD